MAETGCWRSVTLATIWRSNPFTSREGKWVTVRSLTLVPNSEINDCVYKCMVRTFLRLDANWVRKSCESDSNTQPNKKPKSCCFVLLDQRIKGYLLTQRREHSVVTSSVHLHVSNWNIISSEFCRNFHSMEQILFFLYKIRLLRNLRFIYWRKSYWKPIFIITFLSSFFIETTCFNSFHLFLFLPKWFLPSEIKIKYM